MRSFKAQLACILTFKDTSANKHPFRNESSLLKPIFKFVAWQRPLVAEVIITGAKEEV